MRLNATKVLGLKTCGTFEYLFVIGGKSKTVFFKKHLLLHANFSKKSQGIAKYRKTKYSTGQVQVTPLKWDKL